jgi:hypothetical protein
MCDELVDREQSDSRGYSNSINVEATRINPQDQEGSKSPVRLAVILVKALSRLFLEPRKVALRGDCTRNCGVRSVSIVERIIWARGLLIVDGRKDLLRA